MVSAARPLVGVGVIVWHGDLVLLGQRIAHDAEPCWQFPGGHLEHGETVSACALREVREETGLEIASPQLAGFTDAPFHSAGRHYVTLYVTADWVGGEPELKEPAKCAGWAWCHYASLPQPLFRPIELYLDQYADLRTACRRQGIPSGGHR